jgi:hypothetical protein
MWTRHGPEVKIMEIARGQIDKGRSFVFSGNYY